MIRAFLKSILIGSLAGSAPFLLFTNIMAVSVIFSGAGSGESILVAMLFSVYPILVAVPIVAAASLIVGLPLTFLLARLNAESSEAYVAAGVIAGILIPVLFCLLAAAPVALWLALPGAVSGGVTSHTWWRSARRPKRPRHPGQFDFHA